MTTSSTCQLWTALAFIMLMYIDMATAQYPGEGFHGFECNYEGQQEEGVCGTRQESYTYQQSYRTTSYTPCDPEFSWSGQTGQTCGIVYRIVYRAALGNRNVPVCCHGYEWSNICEYCVPGLQHQGALEVELTTERALEVELTTEQQSILNTRIDAMIQAMEGTFDPSRLDEEQFYNTPLIDLNPAQQQQILDSCIAASEIFAPPSQVGRKKRSPNRICPGRPPGPTELVAFGGSGNHDIGQLVWLNGQVPWAFNEECSSYCPGNCNNCQCGKVERTSKALVLVINVGPGQGNSQSVTYAWKDVTIWSCAATY